MKDRIMIRKVLESPTLIIKDKLLQLTLNFRQTQKFDFILGSRAENYDISGITRYFDKQGNLVQADLIPFNKFKLFPNASVQYNLMNQVYVAANYNKRSACQVSPP